jgi:hypothetical protein
MTKSFAFSIKSTTESSGGGGAMSLRSGRSSLLAMRLCAVQIGLLH